MCVDVVLFRFYMPVVTLRVTGFPPETTANTLLRLFRIFGSVYRVHVESGGASCTMSSETGISSRCLPLSLHDSEGAAQPRRERCEASFLFLRSFYSHYGAKMRFN